MPNLIIRAGSAAGIFPALSGYRAEGVAEEILPDALMTITPLAGESFGSASITHRLFEDFRGQADGAAPSATPLKATGTTWGQTNGEIDTAQGIISDRSWYHSANGVILRADFPMETAGFRGSFWLRSSLSDSQIPSGRSKTSWVEEDNGVGIEFDLAFPTKMGSGSAGWGVAGNDFNLLTGLGPHMPANEWVRFMLSFTVAQGWRYVSAGPTYGVQRYEGTDNVFSLGTTNEQVNRWYFGATTDHAIHYGSMMIHTGAGVNASIELGDAENYDNCDHLYDCDIESWASGSVQAYARIPESILTGSTPLWLHGHKADRSHFNASRLGRAVSLS